MTGFGHADHRSPRLRMHCEIRSVNHRYLAVKLRMPGYLMRLEQEVEDQIRRRLKRGAVEVHVQAQASTEQASARLDTQVADRYLRALRLYLKKRGFQADVAPEFLFGLQGVLVPPDPAALARSVRPALRAVVEQALEQLITMRHREGRRLRAVLLREGKNLMRVAGRLRRRAPHAVKDHQKRLGERVQALLPESAPLDEASLAREVALFADRSDVTEELDRLDSHLTEFRSLLDSPEPSGRPLDFLVQELSREVHTIGSKMQDAGALRDVLKAKASVEKLREQVQNIE